MKKSISRKLAVLATGMFLLISAYGAGAQEVVPEKSAEVQVERAKFDLTLGHGMLRGDSTYQIGGTVDTPSGSSEIHFPLSELEFPLDVYMVSLGGSLEFAEKWKLNANVKKNITSDAGKMKDSDWGVFFDDPNSLDIYSESDADLEALITDINLRYRFYKKSNWSFIAGLGYLRQNFDYEVSNLDQWYPSLNDYYGYDIGHDYVSGKVLEYEVTYSIPYMEIGTQFKIKDKFSVEASLGYSPIVNVTDEDNHILRSKVSEGD
ncbi:MAG: omptin family outer membrane protease, partial [Proteobacteria bacterium]|nr:omptin family outer membrane protease [Pseudomonadota bacterium]